VTSKRNEAHIACHIQVLCTSQFLTTNEVLDYGVVLYVVAKDPEEPDAFIFSEEFIVQFRVK
jgi:hypothetical protein